jgi:hypothetical protein
MNPEHAIAAAGLAFLVVGGLMLASTVWRGRRLCRLLSERLPEQYAELGSPRPGFFLSNRRTAYFQFVMQKQFEALGDPVLLESFRKQYKAEVRELVFLLAGFAALGAAMVWLRWFHAA